MIGSRGRAAAGRTFAVFGVLVWSLVLAGTARCSNRSGPSPLPPSTTLRMGSGALAQSTSAAGLRQVASILSLEGLINFKDDGRPRPWLADGWSTSDDGLLLTIRLRPQARFHDGSPVTAETVTGFLKNALPKSMGPAFEDVDGITAVSDTEVGIRLKKPSPFVLESLESLIQKPGAEGVGTGPFAVSDGTNPELRSFPDYYLGKPAIERITMTPYPSIRAAWADLLRGKVDMLYEVNLDALDSLQASNEVSVFSFARHYQYVILFGSRATQFKPADVRRALNAAIDRNAVVRTAFDGHAIPSIGPVLPQHWALGKSAPRLEFDARLAGSLAGRHLTFTCLVPADSVYERLALIVKQQLAAASVDMRVEEASQDRIIEAVTKNTYDAIMIDMVSGPSLFRTYRQLHSKVPMSPKPIGSPMIDAALDQIRHAPSDDEYRAGMTALQRAIVDAPPAIYLASGERARAVSRRFDVPESEDGRDVLATLRLWRPRADQRAANSN
jgi:peptide/nickel transport system substrate-binding protein